MKGFVNGVKNIIRFALAARRSNYSVKDKFEIFRVLTSLYLKTILYKNKEEVTQRIFNFRISAFNYGAINFLFKEIFLSNEYFFETEKSNPKIIDCGANIGMSILYFKMIYPDCSIIAFEPNPYAFALLKKNIEQNALTNIQIYNLALSNNCGEVEFFLNDDKGNLMGSLIKERGGEARHVVEGKQLSSFINDNCVDLIKMDIEGAEVKVVEDLISQNKLNNSKKYIIEFHHRINFQHAGLSYFLQYFEGHGFDYNLETTFTQIKGFQDILIYFYKTEDISTF